MTRYQRQRAYWTPDRLAKAGTVGGAFAVPGPLIGLPWSPGDTEHARRSAMHAAYAARRRRRTR